MDLRKDDPYVSCIKIHGVPILPPLMTEDIRTEMRYYKHLAKAVEERLKRLEKVVCSESETHGETISRNSLCSPENSSSCEEENSSLGEKIAEEKSKEAGELLGETEISLPVEKEVEEAVLQTAQSRKSSTEDEETSRREEMILPESASSDIVTASTDINQYLQDSMKSDDTASTLGNISLESKKPEVPKTLDIVPITVDPTISNSTTPEQEHIADAIGGSLDDVRPKSTSDSDGTTPKLVRQGSYVLDSPSPLLLAHLQEEKPEMETNYVPSMMSNSANAATKRKEWNINQAKSDWELQRRNDIFVVTDSSGQSTPQRVRRNSASNENSVRSRQFPVEKRLAGNRQTAKSVDCLETVLSREKAKNGKNVGLTNGKPLSNGGSPGWKSAKNISILSLADKIGASLGSFNKSSPKKRANTPLRRNSRNLENSPKTESLSGSTQKLMSAVTSEKLVHVFREIQNTHETQMSELIARQQQEQRRMQKEFEKQQVLLLAQIEQTFPGICLPKLAKKIVTPTPSPIPTKDRKGYANGREKNVSLPKGLEMNGSHSPGNGYRNKCPLDDIYPREELTNLPTCQNTNLSSRITNEPKSPPIGLYATSVLNGDRKTYSVSRQLFPLESKTRHVPVLNNFVYEEKHIKAATIITAHVRGYLVRRIMNTERVIALKSTYGEALHCMLKLHVDAPLALPELKFHQRLQLQCDAASMNIVELFAQEPAKRMEIIRQDRQIKRARLERPNSARSFYSFATQRTLARKRLKESGDFQTPVSNRPSSVRTRCQTWASNLREKRPTNLINQGIKRSTSAGAVRKPWR